MSRHKKLKPIPFLKKEIFPGVLFFQESVFFGKRLTNLYWIEIDSFKYKFILKSYLKPRPLIDYLLTGKKIIAGINFGSFYLPPKSLSSKAKYCNLLINKGTIFQFPSNTRETIIEKRGKLFTAKIKSFGELSIGNEVFTWSGSHALFLKASLVIYGLFDLRLENAVGKSSKRNIVDKKNHCIICPRNSLLIGFSSKNNKVFVGEISDKKIDLAKYLFVACGTRKKLRGIELYDELDDFRFDNYVFANNESACSAVFPLVRNRAKLVEVLKDKLVYSRRGIPKPLSGDYFKSWSVILKERNKIIFFINDARPKIINQKGISVFELQRLINKKFNYSWAVVGDSGQSSKLLLNKRVKKVFGNFHYLNYTTVPPSWDGVKSRSIPVGVLAYE